MIISPERLALVAGGELDTLQPIRARRLIVNELPGLARWVLDRAVFHRALEQTEQLPRVNRPPDDWRRPPALPQRPGSCYVLLVNRLAQPPSLLRPAFVMPLSWVKYAGHDPKLPRSLIDVATEVSASLMKIGRIAPGTWGLRLAEETGLETWDLSTWNIGGRSAWPSLVSGLILASHGRAPDTKVWSTGVWRENQGMDDVDGEGLKLKLDLAVEFGVRTFFLPSRQKEQAENYLAERGDQQLAIKAFDSSRGTDFDQTMRDLLAEAGVPPAPHELFEIKRFHYLSLVDPLEQRAYYLRCLMIDIASESRKQLPPECQPTHLITIASDSPELAALMVEMIQPKECLLLYRADSTQLVEEALKAIRWSRVNCKVKHLAFGAEKMSDEISEHVHRFLDGVAPERSMIDLTPGTKEMSLTLALEIAVPGTYLFYRRHRIDRTTKRPDPDWLQPLIWRAAPNG
jgi:hypothetical protein